MTARTTATMFLCSAEAPFLRPGLTVVGRRAECSSREARSRAEPRAAASLRRAWRARRALDLDEREHGATLDQVGASGHYGAGHGALDSLPPDMIRWAANPNPGLVRSDFGGSGAVLEAPAFVAGFDDVAVVRQTV